MLVRSQTLQGDEIMSPSVPCVAAPQASGDRSGRRRIRQAHRSRSCVERDLRKVADGAPRRAATLKQRGHRVHIFLGRPLARVGW